MCCGGQTQTVVSSPEVPDWLEDYYQYQTAAQKELYDKARNIYNETADFQLYSEPRLQNFTADELQSFNLIRQNMGAADPAMAAATARASQGGRTYADMGGTPFTGPSVGIESLTSQNLQPYLNPFTEQVVDRTVEDLREESARQGLATQGAATQAGSFGGSRHGLMDALREDRLNRSVGQVGSQLRSAGYQQGMAARQAEQGTGLSADLANQEAARQSAALNRATFQADQARMLQSSGLASGLADQQQRQLQTNAQLLSAQGAQQRAMGQQGQDLAYQDFLQQQAYPYGQLGFLQSAMSQTPFNPAIFTGQTQTTTGAEGSMLGQIAGLGIAGLGAVGGGKGLAALGFCWVAREVYGVTDSRWLVFRDFVLHEAPVWFRDLYAAYGERFARFISDKPRIKSLIKSAMDVVVNRKLKQGFELARIGA
tara:strand:+ start:1552 stop:2832 length:1281 start_codon:yes stop_codon:yes gene_type:complete